MSTITEQLASLSASSALISPTGTLIHASPCFLKLFSIEPQQVGLITILEIKELTPLIRYHEELLNLEQSASSKSFNVFFTNSESELIVLFCSLSKIGDATESYQLIVFDITHIHEMEQGYLETIDTQQSRVTQLESEIQISTNSLIDTNVSLRKEIREHQSALIALQSSESRFRALTETTSDFIWEINSEGTYTYASPKIKDLLGSSPEELIGQKFLLFQNPEIEFRVLQKILSNEKGVSGFSGMVSNHTDQDGNSVIIESSGEAIFSLNDELIGFRGIDRDITERVGQQEKLRKAKEDAEAADAAKSEFLANMSHELRTPLHAILSFSKHGIKKADRAHSEELKKFFNQISISANRLLPLIDSLLDLSQLESGKVAYSFAQNDMSAEILSCISEFSQLAEQRSLTIVFNPEEKHQFAVFDSAKIAQVLRNIIGNAIKFSQIGTAIEIDTRDDLIDKKDYLTVSIKNSGSSIPDDELEKIFEKFIQSSVTKSGAGGSGLGLSISKRIVEDHQGRIWAESPDQSTTIFYFTLPKEFLVKKLGQILVEKGLVSQEDIQQALEDQI
ncbi:MAG: PAS domain S-box protein [Desulfobulbaceae bacterium]|nr:MAG: PAS domain S-box protein [Desulfobulbaceae bacterium]